MDDLFDTKDLRPMLIGDIRDPYDDPDSIFELKLDGERCIAYFDTDETVLVGRRGTLLLPRLPEMEGLHRQANRRCILDGELIVGVGKPDDFDALRARLAHQSQLLIDTGHARHPVSYVVFDILYDTDQSVLSLPLMERKALLQTAVTQSERLALSQYVDTSGRAFFDLVVAQGLEGIVGKEKDSRYFPGKRTKNWTKIKHHLEDDFVLCGYILAEYVAMLLLGQYDAEGTIHYKGRVTLGRRTADFATIAQAPTSLTMPYAKAPPRLSSEKVVWLAPTLVCTVTYIRKTVDGLMRQPHFHALRPDKAPEEAVMQNKEIP